MKLHLVKVLLPLKLDEPFDYLSPEPLKLGTFVQVPLGAKKAWGVVWGINFDSSIDSHKLKSVQSTLDCPPLSERLVSYINWVADYTLTPRGQLLKMSVLDEGLEPLPSTPLYDLHHVPAKLPPQRQKVVDALTTHPCQSLDHLSFTTGVSKAVLSQMLKAEILSQKATSAFSFPFQTPGLKDPQLALSAEQNEAAQVLTQQVQSLCFATTLLDGVTGSGKTEVYYEAILAALRQGQSALVLLPEIGLSSQWLARFAACFGCEPAVWHSHLTPRQRRITWRAIIEGKAPLVVGARSALFLPHANLGVIIVDEEHDASYKQEEQVIYNARDMAVVRAQFEQCPCILASATPSLETMINVQAEKYHHVQLQNRFGGAQLPQVRVVDLKCAKGNKEISSRNWIAKSLRQAMQDRLDRHEQSMLFLNRRGFAPLTLCGECGERLQCHQCSAWMVQHKNRSLLQCHQCGHKAPMPPSCPACSQPDSWVACGPGVERIADEVKTFLPQARLGILTSDTLTSPTQAAALLHQIQEGELDVLVGTQIISKGYHFPNLTLVGVVDADLSLATGDLRAAEKTYQLLHQVAGRAGRAEKPGEVWLQTYHPQNPVIAALISQNRDLFLNAESEVRKQDGFPPFGRLIALILSSVSEYDVERAAHSLAQNFPCQNNVEILGPAPAPLARLQGRYRWRLLIKSPRTFPLQKLVKRWISAQRWPPSTRLQIDVDPYSFF